MCFLVFFLVFVAVFRWRFGCSVLVAVFGRWCFGRGLTMYRLFVVLFMLSGEFTRQLSFLQPGCYWICFTGHGLGTHFRINHHSLVGDLSCDHGACSHNSGVDDHPGNHSGERIPGSG